MRVDAFDYDLPPSLIAQAPASPRDSARLLWVGSMLHDKQVSDLPDILQPGDLLVVNDTKVIPSQIAGSIDGKPVGLTFIENRCGFDWILFAKPGRRLKVGSQITLDGGAMIKVTHKHDDGRVSVTADRPADQLIRLFKEVGAMPLPPYIKRKAGSPDHNHYQTMFAARDGAVAAPTAGLHFTPALITALADRGIETTALTLHVGAGTFLPVKVDDTDDHIMHRERFDVSEVAAHTINQARDDGRRIVAIGTTALRTLESAVGPDGRLQAQTGSTALFIKPGFEFKTVDLLLTNFHLPKSTLMMLVAAFAGLARIQEAYRHAIDRGYRFFSYGDATLLERNGR